MEKHTDKGTAAAAPADGRNAAAGGTAEAATKPTAVMPRVTGTTTIYLDYNSDVLGCARPTNARVRGELGYVEVYEISDTNGKGTAHCAIPSSAGDQAITWYCNAPFVLIPEQPAQWQLGSGVNPCLRWADNQHPQKPQDQLLWAAVSSTKLTTPPDSDYPHSLTLTTPATAGTRGYRIITNLTLLGVVGGPQQPHSPSLVRATVVFA